MHYDYFIGMLKQYETHRIRAFSGAQQTNPENVPSTFALLIPDIFSILQNNLNVFCDVGESMVIFGLQPAGGMIVSNKPLEQCRFIDGLIADYHLCCTLDFFKAPINQENHSQIWQQTESIIIDFTTGEIMDSDRLLAKLNYHAAQGQLYGTIPADALAIVWKIVKFKAAKKLEPSFSFNRSDLAAEMSQVA